MMTTCPGDIAGTLEQLRAIEQQIRAAGDEPSQDTVRSWYTAYEAYRAACTAALKHGDDLDAETRALLLSPGGLKRRVEGR